MMHFVRTFSVVRARPNAIKEVRNCGKIAYIKSIFENGWWEDAYPSSYPPGSAPGHRLQKPLSLAYFSNLTPLILFYFTKKQSQKGGMAQSFPPPKYASWPEPRLIEN